MHTDDNAFFEDYKSLEQLCSDIYSCQNGVTEYINQMDQNDLRGRAKVNGWEHDYKMLKHVRWIRNQLAHESPSQRLSEPADRAFVNDFRRRLLNTEDPLTLLEKITKQEKKSPVKQLRQQIPETREKDDSNNRDDSKNIAIGVCVCIVIVIILILVGIVLSAK